MAVHIARIYKNNAAKTITLPAMLCRGLGLAVGDTLMLEPQADGTVKMWLPRQLPQAVQEMKVRAQEGANAN